jgi:glycosyltransferase involved in cell wall biosynthesis
MSYGERFVRVLFFNEGNLGTHVMGQAQLDTALRVGLPGAPEIEAHFAGLSPMGRWTTALATRPLGPFAKRKLDFPVFRWHLVQSLRARGQLRHELRTWPADAVHLHSQSVAMAIAATMRSLPAVLSVDTTVRDWWSMPAWASSNGAPITIAPSRALERRAMRRAALVLAWTDWARRAVEREVPGAHVVEHHPGIDLHRYVPAPRRERARPRVLFVGGRFAEKGGEDLIAALDYQLGREVDLDVVTPSAVPERPGVYVHRLSASDPWLLDLYQQADILVLPTYGDTNPWVLLEAMACGTPVVSTPVGGIPEMLEGGRVGVLVPYGNRRALGEALRALLADSDRRAQLASLSRLRCKERYDARKQFMRLAEYLREVCRNNRSDSAVGTRSATRDGTGCAHRRC